LYTSNCPRGGYGAPHRKCIQSFPNEKATGEMTDPGTGK